MHHFHIIPTYPSTGTADLVAGDASAVLNMVQRLGCREADIFKDGTYTFSVRLGGNGLWCIFGREVESIAEMEPSLG